jgi:glycosyltransferase involved in cell wall biosynthesis
VRDRTTAKRFRVAYLVTHPIQYQAPLLRLIAAQPDIDLTVYFQSDMSLRPYDDPGFKHVVAWDVPLLDGYRSEFLPGFGRDRPVSAQWPINWGFWSRLRRERFDVLWVHGYARFVNLAAILSAKAKGLKVFVRDEATAFSSQRSRPRRWVKRAFFEALSTVVDAFLVIGSANRAYYVTQGIPAERLFSMPYCVDNAFFASRAEEAATRRERLRRELGLEPGRPIILYASKFETRKRAGDLVDAYEKLLSIGGRAGQAYLLLVGDGALREPLEATVRAKELKDAKFLGFRNQSQLPAFYDLCDVFVLPSTNEPWGLVVNEVMAVGRPLVVSDRVGCVADLVKSGVNGAVFPMGDTEALAAALTDILSDPARAERMGLASRKIIAGWSFEEDLTGLRSALAATLGQAG